MEPIIMLEVKYHAKDGKSGEFLQSVIEAGILGASKSEQGNIQYDYLIPIDAQDDICLVEKWADKDALSNHALSEHYRELTRLKEKYIKSTDIKKSLIVETK